MFVALSPLRLTMFIPPLPFTLPTRLRCRYNHSERKNHTKFFAEPPPHWSTTISHRLTPSLYPLLQTNHPFLFVFHLPLSTESLPLHLLCLLDKGAEVGVAETPLHPHFNHS